MSTQHTPRRYSPENPPPLRREGESVEDYRIRCGWDAPKVSAQHTSGPWSPLIEGDGQKNGDSHCVVAGDHLVCIALIPFSSTATTNGEVGETHISEDEAKANVRLIAAAPRLLAACRSAIVALKGRENDEFLRDVIAQATGSAP